MRIALTFDAEHPDRPCTPGGAIRILVESLARLEVPAAFFVQGRWAEADPGAARAIVAAGHLVGNHSHHHAPYPSLTIEGVAADLTAAERAIRDVTGVDPRPWFRLPFGRGGDHPTLRATIVGLGYRAPVGWDVDTLDWDAPSAAAVMEAVHRGLRDRVRDAIVLLHTWPDATHSTLPDLVATLRDTGHELVGLDVLDGP